MGVYHVLDAYLSFIYWWLIELPFRDAMPNESIFSQFFNLFVPHKMQLCNVVLWFLPCLFISSIISNYINIKIKSIRIRFVIIAILLSFVGNIKGNIPFLLGQVLQSIPFILMGYIIKEKLVLPEVNRKRSILLFVSALFCIIPIWFMNVTCNMLSCYYKPNYPILFMIALWATCCVGLLSYAIKKNRMLSWLGSNSLAIMLIHEPVKRIVIKIYSMVINIPIDILRESILQSLIITSLVIILLIPIVLFINKYTPFLLGKKQYS